MNEAQTIGPVIWLVLIVFSLLMYMVLDGYDLGVGLLFFTEKEKAHRDEMVDIVATAWDGNESWLVLVGIALYGGFPLAYSVVLPALYVPLIVMLFALILRGVSFEFQSQFSGYSRLWGRAFAVGSIFVALCQGLALGAVLSGISTTDRLFSGGSFSFLTPFSILVSLFVLAFYGLLGAGWLIHKTDSSLLPSVRRTGRILGIAAFVLLLAVFATSPFASPVAANIDGVGKLLFVLALALVAAVGVWLSVVTLARRADTVPFLLGAFALVVLVVGGVVAAYPYIVPPDITLREAASPRSSVNFLLIGVGLCMPFVLTYNAYAYWVFRGRFDLPNLTDTGKNPGS